MMLAWTQRSIRFGKLGRTLDLCDPEIQNLGCAIILQEDILRLDIAMHHISVMRSS